MRFFRSRRAGFARLCQILVMSLSLACRMRSVTEVKIIIYGQYREVRPFVPSPLQCKKCSKYGHTEKKCHNNAVCAYCSSTEHETKWNCGTPKCANCNENHHARSKKCAFHLYNTELKILQDRTGMSIKEAKLELRTKGFNDPSKKPM